MYKRMLVPLDGSKRAEKILPYVEELAKLREGTVIVLQVIETSSMAAGPYDATIYFDQEATERILSDAKSYLRSAVEVLRNKGIAARSIVETGPVVRAILDVAEREQVDLVAMASHGRTGLSRVFYGSVAAGVMQQADRPLLLIRSN